MENEDSTNDTSTMNKWDFMPAPFAWIRIEAGQVTLKTQGGSFPGYVPHGEGKTFDVPAFSIAKYLATNAQYALFIKAGGYHERRWWTDAGWVVREQGYGWDHQSSSVKQTGVPWTEPRFWQVSPWNIPDHPVVGVSWYEAVAFCRWLSEKTDEQIMLPTEQQWQRAAQGNDNRAYPWGKKWDGERCNNSVGKRSRSTTPVTHFEGADKGDSPFGVTDMAGNVSEWCSTVYDTGSNDLNKGGARVKRIGSWDSPYKSWFHVDYRAYEFPRVDDDMTGFRFALL